MNGAHRPVVLITGAARRIGRAIALDFARRGWRVAIHYHRSAEAAAELVRSIERDGGQAAALSADLSDTRTAHGLIARAGAALGPPTCLVNNAAVFFQDRIDSLTRESWDAHIETNLYAALALIQDFAAALPEGDDGNVINLLDERVWNPTPFFLSYTVSKSALWTLTRTLALALAPRIRVNGIGPGPALPSPRQTPAQFARQCARLPLKRGTTPEEICRAIRFILEAPSMTGQMIALDGGQHLGWAQPEPADQPVE